MNLKSGKSLWVGLAIILVISVLIPSKGIAMAVAGFGAFFWGMITSNPNPNSLD